MTKPKRHLITAALPYANGPLHIGHLAGAYLPADIYAKYLRARKKEVLFVCGSDEHGAAITLRAKNEGISPRGIIDKYHAINEKVFADMGFDFDIFHRTSSALHHETAQKFFLRLYDKGVFQLQESEQFYDEEYGQFLADRYISGECPKCGYDKAYGDQCERCGSSLNPSELINPVSVLSNKKPQLRKTEHYYLPMDAYQGWVEKWITEGRDDEQKVHNPKQWKKHVLGQCMSWLQSGLKPRAMTRDLDWGVPVPLEGAEGKVLYVWLDAPIGYISASKQWAKDTGASWESFWKDAESELVHFIGKDNIVFHCIIFPILLKAHGDYRLPVNVPANEFLNLEGQKLSTSRNWAIWVHEYIADFPDKLDELRFVLNAIAPETKDSEFTWLDYQARVNNELVAIYGNFVNRCLVLTGKYYNNACPHPGSLNPVDKSVLASIKDLKHAMELALEQFSFREAQAQLMNLARLGNKYLADEEPWKKIKTDERRVAQIMYVSLQISAALAILSHPFLPEASKKLKLALGLDTTWDEVGEHELLAPDSLISSPGLLFNKIEDDWVQRQRDKMQKAEPKKEQKAMISFEDFSKLDLRIAEIVEAEKHPDADKLLVLRLDLGDERRTVVSGIAAHYSPEEIIGKKVTMLTNLVPRKIRGIESQGMILMAEDAEHMRFLDPGTEISNGSLVR